MSSVYIMKVPLSIFFLTLTLSSDRRKLSIWERCLKRWTYLIELLINNLRVIHDPSPIYSKTFVPEWRLVWKLQGDQTWNKCLFSIILLREGFSVGPNNETDVNTRVNDIIVLWVDISVECGIVHWGLLWHFTYNKKEKRDIEWSSLYYHNLLGKTVE